MQNGRKTRTVISAVGIGLIVDAAQVHHLLETERAVVAQTRCHVEVVASLHDDRQLTDCLGSAQQEAAKCRLEVRFQGLEFACHIVGEALPY